MTDNPSPGTTVRPLSVGNIVSAGVRLYRDRPDTYLSLSLFAHLWIFVPVYGWAKYNAIAGLMSRLAFGELTGQPETVEKGRARVRARLWSFLLVAFLISIRVFGIYFAGVLVIGLVAGILSVVAVPLGILAGVLLFIALIVILVRFFSRWFIAEVPLAVEPSMTGGRSLDRSWQLTQKAASRVQIVVAVAFLITLPLTLSTGYLPNILFAVLAPDFAGTPLAQIVVIVISLAGGIVVLPFWQIIKAVTYYDLRSRQEGLDLELRGELDALAALSSSAKEKQARTCNFSTQSASALPKVSS